MLGPGPHFLTHSAVPSEASSYRDLVTQSQPRGAKPQDQSSLKHKPIWTKDHQPTRNLNCLKPHPSKLRYKPQLHLLGIHITLSHTHKLH